MTLNKIFFVYMALAGAAAGAILVAAPHVQDFVIKPYFWVLIAVGLFDGGIYLFARNAPATMLTICTRDRIRDRDRADGGNPVAGRDAGSISLTSPTRQRPAPAQFPNSRTQYRRPLPPSAEARP